MSHGRESIDRAAAALLIVEEDRDLLRLLTAHASVRGYLAVSASGLGDLPDLTAAGPDVVLLDLGASAEAVDAIIRRLRGRAPDAEIIVTSATASMALALQAYEGSAFAFVQKPYEVGQLFATIDRALERRRMNLDNARLHDTIARAKREWEQTFDAIGDPIAVFDRRGELLRGNAALAAHLGRPVTGLRGARCRDVGFCGGNCEACAVARALANQETRAEVTLDGGQIFSVTTFPVAGGSDGVSVVQVAKNVTEEIRSARRLRQMSDELEAANAQALAALARLRSTQAQLLQSEK